jgi:diguanylate cyclase (GGDEF)-like protein
VSEADSDLAGVEAMAALARAAASGEPGGADVDALVAAVESLVVRVGQLERRAADTRTALDTLSTALGSPTDRAEIVAAVVDAVALSLGAASTVFYAAGGGRLSPRSFRLAASDAALAERTLAEGEGVAGAAAKSGEPVVWPGPIAPSPSEPAVDAAVAVPIGLTGRPSGVIALYGRQADRPPLYDSEDIALLRSLVRQAEVAAENAWLYDEARRLSITDGLTGVWNRRQFDIRVNEEHHRATRFSEPFGVVLVDIDHFKEINDRHGHQAGDAVLVDLARRLTDATREVDVVARYGGEEFALILPKTSLSGAAVLADKVRETIGREPFVVEGTAIPVTISAGVAGYPDHGTTVRELVAAADAALYRAKAGGRNRIEEAVVRGKS